MLAGLHIRTQGFDHPLWEKAEETNDDKILKLFQQYRETPTKELKEKLLFANLYTTLCIVGKYIAVYRYLDRDDFVSAGLLGLSNAIDRCLTIKHDNIGGFIVKHVHHFISQVVKSNNKQPKQFNENFEIFRNQINRAQETYDAIISLLQNDTERKIVDLRCEGHTDEEIGNILGIGTTTVWVTRKSIERRFNNVYMA